MLHVQIDGSHSTTCRRQFFLSIVRTLDQTQVVRLGGKWLYPWAISLAPKSSISFLWCNPKKCLLTEDDKNRTLYSVLPSVFQSRRSQQLCCTCVSWAPFTLFWGVPHCPGAGQFRLLWLASEPQGSSSQDVWPFSCVLGIELSTVSFLQTEMSPSPLHPLTP